MRLSAIELMVRCCLLALVPSTAIWFVVAAKAIELPGAIQAAETPLQQAWSADPRTAGGPWPLLVPVPDGTRPQDACPQILSASPETLALYCPAKGQVLLDLKRLKAVEDRYGTWGVGYWIGTALGQAIRDPSAEAGTEQRGPAANLQAICLGGVLLGQARGLRPIEPKKRLSPAFTAYPARLNPSQGTPTQRAYALLTGLGATASDCSLGAMVSLSKGKVPDPERLTALAIDPAFLRTMGDGAIDEVINALCLPRPPLGCPRRLPAAARVRTNP
jgi:hypothetical protein